MLPFTYLFLASPYLTVHSIKRLADKLPACKLIQHLISNKNGEDLTLPRSDLPACRVPQSSSRKHGSPSPRSPFPGFIINRFCLYNAAFI